MELTHHPEKKRPCRRNPDSAMRSLINSHPLRGSRSPLIPFVPLGDPHLFRDTFVVEQNIRL